MGVKAPICTSHVGNSPTSKNFLQNKGDLSVQEPTSGRDEAAPNLHSDSKRLCGTTQHKFTGETGKHKKAGLLHLTSLAIARLNTC